MSPLARGDIYKVVVEAEGRVIGSNFLWENGAIVGVGPITIAPAARNVAVGRRLMEDISQRAWGQGSVGSDWFRPPTTTARYSCTKLGFDTRESLLALQGAAIEQEILGYAVRPAAEKDLHAWNRFCFRIHGQDRELELLAVIRQGSATVVEHGGRISLEHPWCIAGRLAAALGD